MARAGASAEDGDGWRWQRYLDDHGGGNGGGDEDECNDRRGACKVAPLPTAAPESTPTEVIPREIPTKIPTEIPTARSAAAYAWHWSSGVGHLRRRVLGSELAADSGGNPELWWASAHWLTRFLTQLRPDGQGKL